MSVEILRKYAQLEADASHHSIRICSDHGPRHRSSSPSPALARCKQRGGPERRRSSLSYHGPSKQRPSHLYPSSNFPSGLDDIFFIPATSRGCSRNNTFDGPAYHIANVEMASLRLSRASSEFRPLHLLLPFNALLRFVVSYSPSFAPCDGIHHVHSLPSASKCSRPLVPSLFSPSFSSLVVSLHRLSTLIPRLSLLPATAQLQSCPLWMCRAQARVRQSPAWSPRLPQPLRTQRPMRQPAHLRWIRRHAHLPAK